MNMKSLMSDFINHVNAMSDDEVRDSMREASRLAAKCEMDETSEGE